MLIVGTAFLGFAAVIMIFAGFQFKAVFIGMSIGFVFGNLAPWVFLCQPKDHVIAQSLKEIPNNLSHKARELEQARRPYCEALKRYERLQRLLNNRRNALLQTEWRLLVGIPFERFLAEVFEELGYSVETTKASGDQGVDLIVTRGGLRLAIQAKGYAGSVGNKAVQEAYTGMCVHACNQCAVITNSQFTAGAREAADKTGCTLIAGDQIRELIFGKIL